MWREKEWGREEREKQGEGRKGKERGKKRRWKGKEEGKKNEGSSTRVNILAMALRRALTQSFLFSRSLGRFGIVCSVDLCALSIDFLLLSVTDLSFHSIPMCLPIMHSHSVVGLLRSP